MRRVEIKSKGKTEVTWGKEGKAEGRIGKQEKWNGRSQNLMERHSSSRNPMEFHGRKRVGTSEGSRKASTRRSQDLIRRSRNVLEQSR